MLLLLLQLPILLKVYYRKPVERAAVAAVAPNSIERDIIAIQVAALGRVNVLLLLAACY